MRIGTPIFLLVIILVAFGYVLSDDHHIRNDLRAASSQLEGLNRQFTDVNQQLDSCRKTVQDKQQVISQQGSELTALKNAITEKERENTSLRAEIARRDSRITELEGNLAGPAGEQASPQPAPASKAWLQLDPVLVAALLVVQLVWFLIQRKWKNSYVRLSAEERAHIIKRRRLNRTK